MPRRRGLGRKPKGPKAKKLAFELIEQNDKKPPEPYKLLAEVREEYHEDTLDAKVALAWHKDVKADKDGHILLGKCHKVSDLFGQFVDYDFVIELNKEAWDASDFSREKKLALLDHEMCHIGSSEDKNGEPKVDERGNKVWRTVKHDISEFHAVVKRHGCYKADLEKFAEILLKRQGQLFQQEQKPQPVAAVQ